MHNITAESFALAYEGWIETILKTPEYITAPRGQKIYEIENLSMTIINPRLNLFNSNVRPYPLKYLKGELIWYFSGRNDVAFISKYSKFWKNIVNPDGKTVNSAYGHLIFTEQPNQWHWAKTQLIKDKDTRQAIIHFNKPQHQFEGNKDFVCTMYMKFSIRDNKLNCFVAMRSSDAYYGLTYDIPFFTILQQHMLYELKEELKVYPELELGEFTLLANSAHIYERNKDILEKMIGDIWVDSTPEVDTNLILNEHLLNLDNYEGDSKFLNWLKNIEE